MFLSIPGLVFKIVSCVFVGFGADCIRTVLDLLGRNACIDARLKFLIGWNHGTSCNDGSVWNDGVIHYDRTHSDDYIVADYASVYVRSVSDGNILADYAL